MTETSAVHYLPAQWASCNENDESVMSDIMLKDSDITETSAVYHLPAQWASCNENDRSVMLNIMSENSNTTEISAVHHLQAQVHCNKNDENVISETDSMTETSAVYNYYAQRANCVISKEISNVIKAHTVQCLSAQEASWDSVRESEYAELKQHSIKNSAADTAAMNISDTVNHASLNLWIENSASADTVEVLQLMSSHSLINEKITVYTKMSVE